MSPRQVGRHTLSHELLLRQLVWQWLFQNRDETVCPQHAHIDAQTVLLHCRRAAAEEIERVREDAARQIGEAAQLVASTEASRDEKIAMVRRWNTHCPL